MGKHQFAAGIKCGGCGEIVGAVWAPTLDMARQGGGVCDACREKLAKVAAAPEVIEELAAALGVPPPDDDGAGAFVQAEYAGAKYDTTVLAEDKPVVVVEVVKPETPKRGAHRGKAGAV